MKIKKSVKLLLIFFFLLFMYIFISFQLIPLMLMQAKIEMHEMVKEKIVSTTKSMPSHEFITQETGSVHVNTFELNQWLSIVNHQLEQQLQEITLSLPIGSFTGILFFYQKGPAINCHFIMKERVLSRYLVDTIPLGINNTMLKVSLEIEMKGNVMIGFQHEEIVIRETIPVILEYIQGQVPEYFIEKKDSNNRI